MFINVAAMTSVAVVPMFREAVAAAKCPDDLLDVLELFVLEANCYGALVRASSDRKAHHRVDNAVVLVKRFLRTPVLHPPCLRQV